MKTQHFYYFAAGVCALLLILLLIAYYPKSTSKDQAAGPKNQKTAPLNQTVAPRGKNPNAPTVTAFQFVTDKLNKMGIAANGVDIDVKAGTVKWGSNSKWGEYYGKPGSDSQAIAPMIMQLHQDIKANPQGIRGCYQTKWGILRLFVKDDVVTGTLFYYGPVHIIGKVKDNILVGVWIRPANKKRPMLTGPVQFAFAQNWSAFRSVWKFKKEPQFNSKWVGTKIKCPPGKIKPTQNLEPGGIGMPIKPKPGQPKPGPTGAMMPQKSPPPVKQ